METSSSLDWSSATGPKSILPSLRDDTWQRVWDAQQDTRRPQLGSPNSAELTRARRVMILLGGVWLLSLFDLTLTLRAQADGVLNECNPLASYVLTAGAPALLAFKLLPLLGASALFARFRHKSCTEVGVVVSLLAYAGVALQWKLCYQMYEIMIVGNCGPASFEHVDAIIRNLPTL